MNFLLDFFVVYENNSFCSEFQKLRGRIIEVGRESELKPKMPGTKLQKFFKRCISSSFVA